MHHREALGPADVDETTLIDLVAASFGEPSDRVTVLDSSAERVGYDLPALTTAGRFWVRGSALVGAGHREFCFFVKHVQSFSRSPLFASVPAEIAVMAEASVPWQTEPLIYRSDLGDRLPLGLRMPRAFGVFDLDESSASVWLEAIPALTVRWDEARFADAAFLLGRLAASPAVQSRAKVGEGDRTVRDYFNGRLTHQVIPSLRDAATWDRSPVAEAFDSSLRDRLMHEADRAEDLVDELADLPLGTIHGDACPNNLLITPGAGGFVLIDYGFFGEGPIGFDLGQLLVGDIQIGRQPASNLRSVENAILPAYVDGLRAEGSEISLQMVRRAHALHLMLFTGLSIPLFEHLGDDRGPSLHHEAAERARIAQFCLDLLAATDRTSGPSRA
ncbi:MAG: phosphotransferase [Nocardioides sp.]